jgi:hypothetical protein
MSEQCNQALNSFEGISISEMDSVAFLNRFDTKFIFKENLLAELLPLLTDQYKVLDVNSIRNSSYETLYYDTPSFELFRQHQIQKPNRLKIRFRKYLSSDSTFFELKFKNSKGKTNKKRVSVVEIPEQITDASGDFLSSNTSFKPTDFRPKLWVNFDRITLVNKNMTERITLDTNLAFINGEYHHHLNEFAIAEVKSEKNNRSLFMSIMRNRHIRSTGISKYCIGVALCFKHIRSNNFKPQLLAINKIRYGASTVN